MARRSFRLALLASALRPAAALAQTVAPNAQPTGGRVVAGAASIAQTAAQTTITQASNRAAIDWQSFNVGANQSVQFNQPNAQSWTLNRVVTPDPSVIAGRVSANGHIAIVNQSGVVFAEGAQVNVAGLIASAANITNENFMAGRMQFTDPARPGARVENRGTITVADQGLAVLAGPRVANSGTITARMGHVALQGAEAFTLDLAGDGMLALDVTQQVRSAPGGAAALVTNEGTIVARGGTVQLSAAAASGVVETLVNNTGRVAVGRGQVALSAEGGGVTAGGTITARSRSGQGGSITATATGTVTVPNGAVLDASGATGGGRVQLGGASTGRVAVQDGATVRADATRNGNGGRVVVNSARGTVVNAQLSARGGPEGGNGGLVETSSAAAFAVTVAPDVRAPRGRAGGWLIDPTDVEVVTGGGAIGTATVDPSLINAFSGALTLSATHDITVTNAILRTADSGANTLTLTAGNSITVNANVAAPDGLTLTATGGALTLAANLTAGTVGLTAGTGISQTNGIITAGLLGANTTGGGIDLGSVNAIDQLGAITSGGGAIRVISGSDLTLTDKVSGTTGTSTIVIGSGGLLTVNGAGIYGASSTGTVTLYGGSGITLNSSVIIGGDLRLFSDGAIAGANAALTVLSLAVAGYNGTGAAASVDLSNSLNTIPTLTSVRATGAVAISDSWFSDISVAGVSGGSVALVALPGNGLNVLSSAAGGLGISATGNISLVADAVTVGAVTGTNGNAAIRSTGNGTITLRADALTWSGKLDAGSGTVEIGPRSAGKAVEIAATGSIAGALLVTPGTLAAGTLRIGETTIGADIVTAGALTLTDALAAPATLDLAAGGAIALNASLGAAGSTVTLRSTGGGVGQGAGIISAGTLTVNAAGTVALGLGNAVDAVTISAAGQGVTFTSANALTVNGATASGMALTGAGLTVAGAVTGGTITLNAGSGALAVQAAVGGTTSVMLQADGAISQTSAGLITTPSLTAVGSGGTGTAAASIALGEANSVTTLAEARATGALALRSDVDALTVTLAVGNGITLTNAAAWNAGTQLGGNVTLTGGTLTAAGATLAINANGLVRQDAGGGGAITAASVVVAGGGGAGTSAAAVTLTAAGAGGGNNAIDQLAAAATGAVSVRSNSTTFTINDVTASAITLQADTAMAPMGALVTSPAGTVTLTAGTGGITLPVGGRIVATLLDVSAAGGGVSLLGTNNDFAQLQSSAGITGALTAFSKATGGTLTLGPGGLNVTGGGMAVTSGADLTVTGNLGASAGIALTAAGTLTLQGATTLDAGAAQAITLQANLRAGTSALVLDGSSGLSFTAPGTLSLLADSVTFTGAPTVTSGGTVVIAPVTAGTALSFDAGLTASVANITANQLTLGSAGAGALTFTGSFAPAHVATLNLLSGGDITQTAGALTVAAVTFAASGATAAVTLDGANNSIASFAGTANGAVTLRSAYAGAVSFGAITGASITATTTAGALNVAGKLTATAGITLTGTAIATSADLDAGTGTLSLTATTGAIQADTMLTAGTLVATATGGEISAANNGNAITNLGAISAHDSVTINSDGDLTQGAVTLSAASALVTSNAALRLNGTNTTTNGFAAAGVTDLTLGGSIGNTGSNGITLSSGGTLTLTGTLTAVGQTVALNADGAMAQPGGSITAAAVVVSGQAVMAPSITLDRAANNFAAVSTGTHGVAAGGILTIVSNPAGGTLTLGTLASAGGIVVTTGGNLTVAGNITADLGMTLTGAGTVTLGSRVHSSGGPIGISADADAGGTSAIVQTASQVVTDLAHGRVSLSANSITLLTAANSVEAPADGSVELAPQAAGRAITLGATVAGTLSLPDLAGISAGRLVIGDNTSGAITVAGATTVAARSLELVTAGAITQASGATLTAAAFTATAGGAITLTEANAIDTIAASSADAAKGLAAGGDLSFRTTAATLTLEAGLGAGTGATLTLRADGLALSGTPAISAPGGGTVQLLTNTLGNGITLGGGTALPGTLLVSTDAVNAVNTGGGTLRIGSDGSTTITGTITVNGAVWLRGPNTPHGDAATLDLRGGAVAQAAGVVDVATLTGATSGDFLLDRAVAGAGVNRIATLGALSGAAVTVQDALALNVAGAVTGSAITLASADAFGIGATGSVAGTGAVALSGTSLALAGGVSAVGSLALTASAAGIALNAQTLDVTGGTLTLTAAGDITQTVGGAGALKADHLALVGTGAGSPLGDLRGTGNALNSVESTLAGGLTLTNTGALAITGGGIAASGAVTLNATALGVQAPISAAGQTVTLTATTGSITQAAASPVTAGTLVLSAVGGSALLDGGGAPTLADRNSIATLGDVTALHDLAVYNRVALALNGTQQATGGARLGSVTLDNAGAAITQGGGALRAASVVFATTGANRAVTLDAAGNDIGSFAGTATGAVTLRSGASALSLGVIGGASIAATSAGTLTVAGAQTATGDIALTGTALGLGADLNASAGTVTLTATSGDITQTAGVLTAGTLLATANAGAVSLIASNNAVAHLGASSALGAFALKNDGDLAQTASALTAASVALTSLNGAITLNGTIGTTLGATVTAASGISVPGSITNTSADATLTGIALNSGGALALSGTLGAAGQRLALHADGAVTQTAGSITADTLEVRGLAAGTAAAGITLGRDGANTNAIAHLAEARSSGDLRLKVSGDLTLDGTTLAGSNATLRIEAAGALTLANAGSVLAPGANGAATLWGSGLALNGTVEAAGQVVLVASGGAMSNAALPGAGTAGITQASAGAGITTGQLLTIATGAVTLTGAGNAVGAVSHQGFGGYDYSLLRAAGAALTVGQSVTFTSPAGEAVTIAQGIAGTLGNVALTADGITVNQAITAGSGKTVTLTADALTLAANVTATSGLVVLTPRSADTGITIGGTGGLALDAAQLHSNLGAGTLRLLTTGSGDLAVKASTNLRNVGVLEIEAHAVSQDAGTVLDAAQVLGQARGGDFLLNSSANLLDGAGAITAAGGIALSSATTGVFTVAGALTAGSAQALTLQADRMALNALLDAPAGTITLRPNTASRAINLGAADAAKLALTGADIANIDSAARLVIGTTAGGAITQGGDVALRGHVAALELLSGGAVTQSGNPVLDVAGLAVQGTSIALTGTANAVDGIVALTAGSYGLRATTGALSLRDGTTLTLGVAASAAGDLALTATALTLNAAITAGASNTATLTATTGDLTANSTIDARDISFVGNAAGTITNAFGASATATRNLGFGSAGSAMLVNRGTLTAGSGTLTAQGGQLDNYGTLQAGDATHAGTVSITVTAGALTNHAGAAIAAGDGIGLTASGQTITNDGTIQAGLRGSGGALTAAAQAIANAGALSADGAVHLTVSDGGAGTLGQTGTGSILAGTDVTLDTKSAAAGAATLAGSITATTGTVALAMGAGSFDLSGSIGAGTDITLGAATGTTRATAGFTAGRDLALTLATIGTGLDGTHSAARNLGVTVSTGALTLAGSWTATAGTATLTSPQAITLTGTLTANGAGPGGVVDVESTGGALVVGTGQLIARRLTGTLGAGTSLTQTAPGSAGLHIGELGDLAVAGNLAFTASSTAANATFPAFQVNGTVSVATAGALTLTADSLAIIAGGLRAPGGAITVRPYAAGRGMTLGGKVAGTLGLSTAELALLGSAATPADTLTLGSAAAGTMTLAANVTVAGASHLRLLSGADITETAGAALVTASLAATAGGNLLLDPNGSGNLVPVTAGLSAGGTLVLRSDSPLLTLAGTTSAAGGTLTISADDLAVTGPVLGGGGIVTLLPVHARPVTVGATVAGALSLDAGELAEFGTLTLLRLGGLPGATALATNITLTGPVVVAGGAGQLELRTTGAIQGSAAQITANQVSGVAQGDIILDNAANRFAAGGFITAPGQTISLRDPPNLVLNGPITAIGGTVILTADDAIIQNPGAVITTGTLILNAGGAVSLTEPNVFTTLGTSILGGGSLHGPGYTLAGTITSTGPLALIADGFLTIAGTTTVAGDTSLAAGGALTLSGSLTSAGALTGTAGGGFALTGNASAGGAIGFGAASSMLLAGVAYTPTTFTATAGGTLTARGSLGAETARLTAPYLVLDGATASIGTAILFSAPGGIGAGAASTITARYASQYPAVVFDTRGGSPTDPLSLVRPDLPGLNYAQQATQVRQPNVQAPGTFGAASGNAAGTVLLNLDAGQSPVFLLIDGGQASGSIAAGRLGIQGVGGSVGLVGSLNGVGGSSAATYADITRPIDATGISNYRINGCVVAGINCTPPPIITFVPLRPVLQVELTLANNRIDTSEVTIPNVGEDED